MVVGWCGIYIHAPFSSHTINTHMHHPLSTHHHHHTPHHHHPPPPQVHGERKFDLAGFLLVMSASAMSGLRWTYTQVQLQGAHGGGFTGGPLEVLEQLTPVASITVGLLSLVVEKPWTLPQSPYFQDMMNTAVSFGLMSMGGVIAFLMVWAEFQVISFTSALTLMIAGTFKELVSGMIMMGMMMMGWDVYSMCVHGTASTYTHAKPCLYAACNTFCTTPSQPHSSHASITPPHAHTVVAGVLCFGDQFTAINGLGLCIVTLGVILYNIHKYRKLKKGEMAPLHGSRKSLGAKVCWNGCGQCKTHTHLHTITHTFTQ